MSVVRVYLQFLQYCSLESLIIALENSTVIWPENWRNDILEISSSLSSYAEYLKQANNEQQKRQSALHPVRQVPYNTF